MYVVCMYVTYVYVCMYMCVCVSMCMCVCVRAWVCMPVAVGTATIWLTWEPHKVSLSYIKSNVGHVLSNRALEVITLTVKIRIHDHEDISNEN